MCYIVVVVYKGLCGVRTVGGLLDILFAVFFGRLLIGGLGDLGKQESPNIACSGGLKGVLHPIIKGGLSNAAYTAYMAG